MFDVASLVGEGAVIASITLSFHEVLAGLALEVGVDDMGKIAVGASVAIA
jgi:hypothetical protein